jgi:hypothetical protein
MASVFKECMVNQLLPQVCPVAKKTAILTSKDSLNHLSVYFCNVSQNLENSEAEDFLHVSTPAELV